MNMPTVWYIGIHPVVTQQAADSDDVISSPRQIVQYISLVRADLEPQDMHETYYTTFAGEQFPWYSADGFTTEVPGGHGSHTAGTAAGAVVNAQAKTTTCDKDAGEKVGCVGGCLTSAEVDEFTSNIVVDVDTMCSAFECDGEGKNFESCLDNDTPEILAMYGGVAQGAKLALFDASGDGVTVWATLAGNGLWIAAEGTGAMVHTNSWGGDTFCNVDVTSVVFDLYMYEVRSIGGTTVAIKMAAYNICMYCSAVLV